MIQDINVNIDYDKLVKDFYDLDIDNLLKDEPFQIAVQCRKDTEKATQLYESCGSLIFDWKEYEKNPVGRIPLRKDKLKEQDFTETCDLFGNTYIDTVIQTIKQQHNVVRGRFMLMKHKTCLTMHVDKTKRIHIPIYTNKDCMMIINDNICRMPYGKTYLVDTTVPHTALNASKDPRVHLVFCLA